MVIDATNSHSAQSCSVSGFLRKKILNFGSPARKGLFSNHRKSLLLYIEPGIMGPFVACGSPGCLWRILATVHVPRTVVPRSLFLSAAFFFLACGHVDEVSLEATQRDERMITTCAYTSCVRAQGQIKLQVNVQYAISTKRCLLDLLFFSHDALANLTDCDLAQK
jgi:hypothetical protein